MLIPYNARGDCTERYSQHNNLSDALIRNASDWQQKLSKPFDGSRLVTFQLIRRDMEYSYKKCGRLSHYDRPKAARHTSMVLVEELVRGKTASRLPSDEDFSSTERKSIARHEITKT